MFIYIYIYHLLLRGFDVRLGKTRFTNQTNETSFSFRKILFISTVISYFIHRKTNFCQALNRFMRISPVTSCEGSFRG